MAIINCPECTREISSQAVSCPHCGCPLRPQQIEQTSKAYKAAQLVGALLMIPGAFFCCYSFIGDKMGNHLPWMIAGYAVFVIGAGLLISGSVLAWWHHR